MMGRFIPTGLRIAAAILLTTSVHPDQTPAQPPADPPTEANSRPFVHPGILHNQAELVFIKGKVQAGEEPWKSAWKALRESPQAQLSWTPKPRADVFRGPYNNPDVGASEFKSNGAAAYTHAIAWVVTGDKAHAEKVVEILNAYPPVFRTFEGHDARLAIGETAFHFLNAAEIIRYTYDGWKPEDVERFEVLVRDRFYPIIKEFAPNYNGNWDAAMIQSKLAMGVFLNDRRIFDEGLNHCLSGETNGSIAHYFNSLGECQESGRDQGHVQMGIGFLGCACEVAWKQGVDLYATLDNRLAKGYEYTAQYNLGNDVPFEPYRSIDGHYFHEVISPDRRGRFSPIYEKVYHHYHDRLGLDMPYTRQVLEKIRPETDGSSNTPSPWGTLMFAGLPSFPKGFDPAKDRPDTAPK